MNEARNIASRRKTELAAVSAAEARLRDELRHARAEWLQESAAAAGHRGVRTLRGAAYQMEHLNGLLFETDLLKANLEELKNGPVRTEFG